MKKKILGFYSVQCCRNKLSRFLSNLLPWNLPMESSAMEFLKNLHKHACSIVFKDPAIWLLLKKQLHQGLVKVYTEKFVDLNDLVEILRIYFQHHSLIFIYDINYFWNPVKHTTLHYMELWMHEFQFKIYRVHSTNLICLNRNHANISSYRPNPVNLCEFRTLFVLCCPNS